MLNALNTKLLIVIYALLVSLATSLAVQTHRQAAIDAQKAGFDAKWNAAEQNAKQPEIGFGQAMKTRWR